MRAPEKATKLLAPAFVAFLGALLALVLMLPSARVSLREPLLRKSVRGEGVAVALEAREGRRQLTLHRVSLAAADVASLLGHDELQLYFSGVSAANRIARAELRVRSSACELEGRAVPESRDGTAVAFPRSPDCRRADLPRQAMLDLTVEVEGGGALALLGFESAVGAAPGPLQVAPSSAGESPIDVRGAWLDYPERAPRIELLRHLWRHPDTARLWALVAAGVALAIAGVAMFPTALLAPDGARPDARVVWRSASAAGFLAGSLGLLYATASPPLSGPDEPYHLLGFAELTGDSALAADTVVWMGETHVWRIRYQPAERFRTIDVGRPYVVPDPDLRATEVEMRSATLARLWKAIGPLVRGWPAPSTLLALRLANVAVFAIAVGLGTALAVATAAASRPQWLCFPLLFVPSLPFFAMHVSETAVLCACWSLLAMAVAVMVLDGPRAHWAGLPLGLATALTLAGGRAPWPLVALVAALLVGRLALGASGPGPGSRPALVFWAGFGAGASVFFLLLNDEYRKMLDAWRLHFAHAVPASLRDLTAWLLAHPLAGGLAFVFAAAAEVVLGPARRRLASAHAWTAAGSAARVGALALAAWVVLSMAGSLVLSYPHMAPWPEASVTAGERIADALATLATSLRLRDPDYLLSSSFWVGYGWLDTMPGPGFQAVLSLLVAMPLLSLLLRVGRGMELRRVAWLALVGIGALASVVLYVLSTQQGLKALAGRYLIGWYLCGLAVIGTPLALQGPPSAGSAPDRRGTARAAILLAVAGGVHLYCLTFILRRYF